VLEEWNSLLWIGMAPEVVERALAVTDAFALRGSDSVHLASALQLKDELGLHPSDFAFITSDQELKAAALQAGLAVIDPQEQANTARPIP